MGNETNYSRSELAIMLTRACNATCRHCGIESSPASRERMNFETAKQTIIEACTMSQFSSVVFTGGESSLEYQTLLKCLELCASMGLNTRLVSNGWWARREERGERFLGQLVAAGLNEINISADEYHAEYIQPDVVRSAFRIAREYNLIRIVSYCHNKENDPIGGFCSLYSIDRDVVEDLRTYQVEGRRPEDPDKIYVLPGNIVAAGRAKSLPIVQLKTSEVDVNGGCREVGQRPVVYPDGTLGACCCAAYKSKGLTVGNVAEMTIPDLFAQMEVDPVLRSVSVAGPIALRRAAGQQDPTRALRPTYGSPCEVCVETMSVFTPDELKKAAERVLADRSLE